MGGKIYTGQVRYILRDANSLNWRLIKYSTCKYCKVASSSRLSRIVAHLRIFKLFMKWKFDVYELCPLA
jgi:hypothetical protein